MLQEKITTAKDLEEVAKLNRRRQYEEERKSRIFNAKQRMFGIDTNFLQRQIRDKNLRRSMEHEIQRRYDEQVLNQDRALCAMEFEEKQRRRDMQADLNFYRCNYQRKEQTRESDLNVPTHAHAQGQIQESLFNYNVGGHRDDDDVSLTFGISSAKKFDGEDLGYKDRKRRQFEQQRAWLDQQIRERKQATETKLQAEEQFQKIISEQERCIQDMKTSEQHVRSQLQDSVHEYNRKMAQQKQFEREQKKREKMEDDMAEIYNMLTSDILTENPDVSVSYTNPYRRIPCLYRGMTAEEKANFQKEQAQQNKLILARKEHVKLMEQQWEQQALNNDRELKLKEMEITRLEKMTLHELKEYNATLAKKQQAEKQNSELMKRNVVCDEFFEQFNTTSR